MQEAISLRDMFFCSVNPFYLGVYGVLCCNCIPASEQRCRTIMFTYSPPIVCAEDFDLSRGMILCKCFEVFEMLKKFGFMPEKIQPSISWEIIKKCKHIPRLVNGQIRKGSHQITLDELQGRWAFHFSNFSWGCLPREHTWKNPLKKWMLGKPMTIPCL